MEEVIVGVVGVLQFEVLTYRLKNEYNVDIRMQNLPYQYIRWIENEDINVKALNLTSDTRRIQDLHERKLLLFTNSWNITWATEHNPELELSEFGKTKHKTKTKGPARQREPGFIDIILIIPISHCIQPFNPPSKTHSGHTTAAYQQDNSHLTNM